MKYNIYFLMDNINKLFFDIYLQKKYNIIFFLDNYNVLGHLYIQHVTFIEKDQNVIITTESYKTTHYIVKLMRNI